MSARMRDHAAEVVAGLAAGLAAAHDEVLDQVAVERGHLVEHGVDDGGAQVVGAEVDERALGGTADRAAGGGDDDGFGHGIPLDRTRVDGGLAGARSCGSEIVARPAARSGKSAARNPAAPVAPVGPPELERVLWRSRSSASTCGPPVSTRGPPRTSTPPPWRWGSGPTPSGFDMLTLSEHHASPDGYLPSPLVLGGAMAARTKQIALWISALLLPLHDPIRLAEDLAVLDLISGGRVSLVTGLGYRPIEYAMFGKEWTRRGKLLDENLDVMIKAWTGEPFEHRGETVQVTPRPRAAAPPDDHDRRRRHGGAPSGRPGSASACSRRPTTPSSTGPTRTSASASAPRPGFVGRPQRPRHAVRRRRPRPPVGSHRLVPAARRHDLQVVAARGPALARRPPTPRRSRSCAPRASTRSSRPTSAWPWPTRSAPFGAMTHHPLCGATPSAVRLGEPRALRRQGAAPRRHAGLAADAARGRRRRGLRADLRAAEPGLLARRRRRGRPARLRVDLDGRAPGAAGRDARPARPGRGARAHPGQHAGLRRRRLPGVRGRPHRADPARHQRLPARHPPSVRRRPGLRHARRAVGRAGRGRGRRRLARDRVGGGRARPRRPAAPGSTRPWPCAVGCGPRT